MTEEQLNKEWLRKKLKGFSYSNEFFDKILELLSNQYINGLEQSRFDKRMLEHENQELKSMCKGLDSEKRMLKVEIVNYKNSVERRKKEFIEYLEDYIEVLKSQQDSVEGLDLAEEHMLMTLEEVLSKYKEIIGDKE